jgi:hypothetical protein
MALHQPFGAFDAGGDDAGRGVFLEGPRRRNLGTEISPIKLHLPNDRALNLRKRLFASADVIGSVCFARAAESDDSRLHRQPPLAELFFSGSDRSGRRLVVKVGNGALGCRSPGTNSRLNLGTDLHPRAVNVVSAGARATRQCRERERGCTKHQELMNGHVLTSEKRSALSTNMTGLLSPR